MPKPGPRTTRRYSQSFNATAVRLSQIPGVRVQDVAASLYIHPFMLSRWRKQAREGMIMTKGVAVDPAMKAELKELRRIKKACEQRVVLLVCAAIVALLIWRVPPSHRPSLFVGLLVVVSLLLVLVCWLKVESPSWHWGN